MISLIYLLPFRSAEEELKVNVTYCQNLEDLLGRCDFIVVVTPLSERTRGLIGAQQFDQMKKGAIIMNIGRGKSYQML